MSQRQVYHQKPTPAWVTDHESQESLQPHCTISGLEDCLILATRLVWASSGSSPGPASFKWVNLSVLIPGHSWLIWGFSKAQLVWECLSAVFTDYLSMERQDRVYLVSFRDFLKPLCCLLPVFKNLLWRKGCIIHPQNILLLLLHLLSSVLCLNKLPSKTDGFLWD